MKKFILFIVLGTLYFYADAQLRINENGMVEINAQTYDYGSALRCLVPTSLSYAYHLNYNNADRFWVNATGYLWCDRGGFFGSDISLKENITSIENPLDKIQNLKGVRYKYKQLSEDDIDSKDYRFGFIAQDVEQVLPEVVKTSFDDKKGIAYTDIIAVLVEAVKEQQKEIKTLRIELDKSKTNIKRQLDSLDDILTYSIEKNNPANETFYFNNKQENVVLYQNTPNPFNSITTIQCDLPKNVRDAELCVYDISGNKIKCKKILERGHVEVQIAAGELSSGIYTYILIVDGSASQAKQMILSK